MPVRDGRQFIEGLKARPREVWLDGERVQDVTEHPALKSSVRQLARLYDMQSDPHHRDILTYTSPSSGDAVSTSFMAAEDQEGLFKRRQAYRLWAEATFGMMGRAPDFMNITLLCFAEGRQVFARAGERFADNFVGYYEYCRENDVFLTHALVPPQTDRSRSSATQKDEYVNLGLKGETADGIIVQGARMVATLGPVADEVLIYNLPGLRPEDEKYALVFAVPLDVPGLRQICRQPYDAGGGSSYDYPLAANFEESDSLMIFDDVLVPWDRVFVHNSVAAANALFPDTNLRNYTAHQSAVRGLVKMQLAVGTAMALARRVKTDRFLHVQQMLGECLNYVEMVKSCIVRSEAECERTAEGTVRPLYAPLQAVRTSLPTWYPRVIEVIQTLGGGALFTLPSAADFASPIADDIALYYQGAEGYPAEERIKLYRLAWDLCGDAFGMRQLQYERYYAGDPVRQTALNYASFDTSECDDLVERALDMAGSPGGDG